MDVCPGVKFLICETHAVESGMDVPQFFVKGESQKPCAKCFTPSYFQSRNNNLCAKCWEKQCCKIIEKDDGKYLIFKHSNQILMKI